ncbi:MAG: TonB-dependent receptor plug domain-containing protein, partial [Planctomycetota bacterium]|nr:TonB-dependent receptor plug domain-containing protein [Planctomycetota bacterium]
MVISSILVLCVASSTDASDQVLDLPEVVVQPSLIPGLLTFDRSPSLAQSHLQLDPTDFQIDRSLPEVMQAFPGVQVQKTGHGQGSPFLRGFTGQRTVLLVDGIRFDDTVFREGPVQYWNTLDPESFAEILFSPGLRSASAGSGAIGGVVELISSRPDPSSSWGGLVRGRLSSAEQSSGGRLHVSGGDGAIGLECGVHLRSFGDLRTGQGVQPRTGYGTSGLDFRLAWQSGGVDWTVGHDRSRVDDAWRTHSTIYGQPFEGTTIGSDLRRVLDHRRERTILTGSTRDLCALDHVSWTFSRQVQSESRDRVRSDGRRDLQ